MSEGPGQQLPQDPRSGSAESRREVLEGRVIPSRSAQARSYPAAPADPRQGFGPPAGPAAEQSWQGQGPAGPPPQPQGQSQGQPQGQSQGQGQPHGQGGPQGGQGPGPGQPSQQPQPPQQPGGYGPSGGMPRQGGPAPSGPTGPGPGGPAGPPPGAGGFGGGPSRPNTPSQTPFPPQAAPAPAARPPVGAQSPGTPDWESLAQAQESGAKRRKVMMLTGGIVAVAVIAGGVATAVVMSGKSSNTAGGGPTTSASAGSTQPLPPAPTFSSVAPPPPANPLDYLRTPAKDKAPLTPASLFPGKRFTMNGHTYVKTSTAVTTHCATGARSALSGALAANKCRKLIRATYVSGQYAVTVGVAVFDDTAHAAKLQKTAQYIAPLNGGGVGDFCHAVACQMTSNAVARYAYFTISGLKNGKTLGGPTTSPALQAANDTSNFAFDRIIQRGRDAAAADPSRN
ncbi:hypothetical protein [Streptomyces sp. HPF1205]|uniref:hypothetical protein n=1 Tax=Streptomyces sp. HPF1205 TaxID=2873262 RepID=UPI001CECA3D2|nr:hypothetical protein [Streptomyces sp. HPF1205]